MTDPIATVIIVNYNGTHLLRPCLDALTKQTLAAGSFLTWVVDNASSDGSAEVVEREYPWVRLLRSDRNRGFAGGNNLALKEVSTTYAVLLNNDAVPEPDWLANLLGTFDQREGIGAVTGKVLFLPRYLPMRFTTDAHLPGGADPRELGVRIHRIEVDGVDCTDDVLAERSTYGPEGTGTGRFRWTRPAGEALIPTQATERVLARPLSLRITWAADRNKSVAVTVAESQESVPVTTEPTTVEIVAPAGTEVIDVVNNVGGIVFEDGYGADRGYQELDKGQYDEPVEVFTACGNGMALRREIGAELKWFDDDFFLYYEDTDLSWRVRSRGWQIRYQPTAILRHVHAATSQEWSPLFVFHVDRNRLLMLTKNASAALAIREVLRYPLTTASMAVRSMRQAWRIRQRPAIRPTLLRLHVIASYVRLLPVMLGRRIRLRSGAAVSPRELQRWLVAR